MRRPRRRTSRIVGIVLVVVLSTAVLAAVRQFIPARAQQDGAGAPAAPMASITPPPLIRDIPKPEKPGEQPLIRTQTPTSPTPAPAAPVAQAAAPKVEKPVAAPPVIVAAAPVAAPAAAPATTSGNPIADGRRLFDAGELVQARNVLNSAYVSGRLGSADQEIARDLLAKISQQVVFSKRVFRDDPYSMQYTVQPGDRLLRVAANHTITWELIGRINDIPDPRKVRAMQTIKVIKGPFHAVVSKKRFVIDLYLGAPGGPNSVYVTSFPVGLGKDDSTPLGTWQVQPSGKLKNPTYYSPRGEGIIAADDPKNPLGEFWIGLVGIEGQAVNKASYGIHGTIEPHTIGREESMGCIRLLNEDVAIVFELLVEGKSTVVVKE